MSAFDFVGHDEAYKIRNFLKFKIFDTDYANTIHNVLFGQPIDFRLAQHEVRTEQHVYNRNAVRFRQYGYTTSKARNRRWRQRNRRRRSASKFSPGFHKSKYRY